MRVAALYDVHGNLPALEAVLEEAGQEGMDTIVRGGDLVSGPFPAEVFDGLAAVDGTRFVRGNADRFAVERDSRYGGMGAWCASQLDLVVCGHTHVQFDRALSTGLRDQHASWLLEPQDPDETTRYFESLRRP